VLAGAHSSNPCPTVYQPEAGRRALRVILRGIVILIEPLFDLLSDMQAGAHSSNPCPTVYQPEAGRRALRVTVSNIKLGMVL